METISIVFMLLILGFTWGGAFYFISKARKQEKG